MATDIDSTGMSYRDLNERVRKLVELGETRIGIRNVCGHKFIGDALKGAVKIDVYGVPGNDLAAFMDGPEIEVHANGQDCIGNTMSSGCVVVHGHAGDVIGHAMRGGRIFVRDDVGYRAGIHMKSCGDSVPCIVVGGCARSFLGEYMAGGVMVLLGLNANGEPVAGDYAGTGMHGGVIYVRGDIEDRYLGREVRKSDLDEDDEMRLAGLVRDYCSHFGCSYDEVMSRRFIKLSPRSHRPYGSLYAH